jgi:hypothetical protein
MTSFSKLWWAEQKNWRPPNLPVIKKSRLAGSVGFHRFLVKKPTNFVNPGCCNSITHSSFVPAYHQDPHPMLFDPLFTTLSPCHAA